MIDSSLLRTNSLVFSYTTSGGGFQKRAKQRFRVTPSLAKLSATRRTATFVFERICYGLTLFNPEQTKYIQVLILSTIGCFKAFSWNPDLRNSCMSNAHFAPSLGCQLHIWIRLYIACNYCLSFG